MLNKPLIKTIDDKLLVGATVKTSLAKNEMSRVWRQLMPRRKEIKNAIGTNLYSIQVYDIAYSYKEFTLETSFTYIAGIEVTNFSAVPENLKAITLQGGVYAIFKHKGDKRTFRNTMNYIHLTWLPKSKYQLDNRNHFEVLGSAYLGEENPNSEEDVWVPIKLR